MFNKQFAIITNKKSGTYIERVTAKSTGSFNLKTRRSTAQGLGYQYCNLGSVTSLFKFT